jgi:hypothetical protein
MTPEIKAAIALLRSAGYRVSRAPLRTAKKTRVGPTFVAKFADGTVTRMSTYTTMENPDVARGIRLSMAAYESRHRHSLAAIPVILECYFTQDDKRIDFNPVELAA